MRKANTRDPRIAYLAAALSTLLIECAVNNYAEAAITLALDTSHIDSAWPARKTSHWAAGAGGRQSGDNLASGISMPKVQHNRLLMQKASDSRNFRSISYQVSRSCFVFNVYKDALLFLSLPSPDASLSILLARAAIDDQTSCSLLMMSSAV